MAPLEKTGRPSAAFATTSIQYSFRSTGPEGTTCAPVLFTMDTSMPTDEPGAAWSGADSLTPILLLPSRYFT